MLKNALGNMFDNVAMTKIAFYGASVTQQRNGYVNHFAKLSKAKVVKLGFGGMHLNDAGICLVDKAVQTHSDICFIDWFSTYYIGQDGKSDLYIDAIAEKLLKIGCRVIFLFCARNKDLKISDWKTFSKYKKKLVVHEIYYYGGSLKLCTKGSRFSYLYALMMSKVFAAKHRFKVILKTIFRG
jgi:hypothetical protein